MQYDRIVTAAYNQSAERTHVEDVQERNRGGAMARLTDRPSGERIWDRYLSEQDRARLQGKEKKPRGFGQRPALLLIDLYRWVFGDQPEPLPQAAETWPGSCGLAGWEALPHLQQLLAAARAAGIPVVHTTGGSRDEMAHWSRGTQTDADAGGDSAMLDRLRRRDDIVDEVAPIPGEMVIRKASPSAFWGTPLVGHLISQGIDTIIVGGESTTGCVRASVVDGSTYRFRMVVAEECVFDRVEAPHALELFTMNSKYADVIPVADVLQYLSRIEEA
jgi:nicotinamidase-related amidase